MQNCTALQDIDPSKFRFYSAVLSANYTWLLNGRYDFTTQGFQITTWKKSNGTFTKLSSLDIPRHPLGY